MLWGCTVLSGGMFASKVMLWVPPLAETSHLAGMCQKWTWSHAWAWCVYGALFHVLVYFCKSPCSRWCRLTQAPPTFLLIDRAVMLLININCFMKGGHIGKVGALSRCDYFAEVIFRFNYHRQKELITIFY